MIISPLFPGNHHSALVDRSNDAHENLGQASYEQCTHCYHSLFFLHKPKNIYSRSVAPVITSMYLSSFVMKARKEYDIQYPNLYGKVSVVVMREVGNSDLEIIPCHFD